MGPSNPCNKFAFPDSVVLVGMDHVAIVKARTWDPSNSSNIWMNVLWMDENFVR